MQRAPEDPRLFFCHIPKTAGVTLAGVLQAHVHQDEIFPFHTWQEAPSAWTPEDLRRYRLFRGHFHWPSVALLDDRPFALTMLRHPVERALSAYEHIRRDPTHPAHHAIGGSSCTLEQFMERAPSGEYSNTQVSFLSAPPLPERSIHAAAVHHAHVSRESARYADLARAKDVLESLDFVGITERFDDSMAMLGSTLGWEPIGISERQNVGGPRTAFEVDGMRDRLFEANAEDLELYAFGVALFEKRLRACTRASLWQEFVAQDRFKDPPDRVRISFEQPIYGTGWRERETGRNGEVFRWIGATGDASLYVAVEPAEEMELQVRIAQAIAPEALEQLRLSVNGHPVSFRGGFDWRRRFSVIEARVPGRLFDQAGPIAVIDFRAPYAAAPRDVIPGSGDRRKLSVAVAWLSLAPRARFFPWR